MISIFVLCYMLDSSFRLMQTKQLILRALGLVCGFYQCKGVGILFVCESERERVTQRERAKTYSSMDCVHCVTLQNVEQTGKGVKKIRWNTLKKINQFVVVIPPRPNNQMGFGRLECFPQIAIIIQLIFLLVHSTSFFETGPSIVGYDSFPLFILFTFAMKNQLDEWRTDQFPCQLCVCVCVSEKKRWLTH